jgi:hypothetical protein
MALFRTLIFLVTTFLLATRSTALPWEPTQTPCSPVVNGLISGIEINILAQWGEKNASIALQQIESKTPVDMTAFNEGKAVLVNDIMFGMQIRVYNQLIAPAGNAALPGLAKVGVELLTGDMVMAYMSSSTPQPKRPSLVLRRA